MTVADASNVVGKDCRQPDPSAGFGEIWNSLFGEAACRSLRLCHFKSCLTHKSRPTSLFVPICVLVGFVVTPVHKQPN